MFRYFFPRPPIARVSRGYLLVRPGGGWNDKLCQIDKALAYAQLSGRTLLIDTFCMERLGAAFSYFFEVNAPNVIYSEQEVTKCVAQLQAEKASIFPPFLQNRLFNYSWEFNHRLRMYCTGRTRLALDFEKNYSQTLLVHHNAGGGSPMRLFSYLRLTPLLRRLVTERLAQIPKPYFGVHVRHTDKTTPQFENFLQQLVKDAKGENIFISTDNSYVRAAIIAKKSHFRSVSFFSELPSDGKALHILTPRAKRLTYSTEALCDLFLLAHSEKIIQSNSTSGFSTLADSLRQQGELLAQCMGTMGNTPLDCAPSPQATT